MEKREILTNMSAAKAAGVRTFPTLVSGGQQLSGALLSEKKIREFLDSL